MANKHIRSRLLPLGSERLSKEQQEDYVGQVLAEGYGQVTGTALTPIGRPRQDPPDLLFDWRGVTVGAELFELQQFYPPRALMGNLTNLIYEEFDKRGLGDRYEGTLISLGVLASRTTDHQIKAKWRRAAITSGTAQAASELVDLVTSKVASRDAIPDTDFGLVIRVDPGVYPALAAITRYVVCNRCGVDTVLRTDGRAAPLLLASPGYTWNDPEMVKSVAYQLTRKAEQKARPSSQASWSSMNHSILVAHDHPRWRRYELFGMKWEKYLRVAADQTRVLAEYDELWLVAHGRRLGEWEAVKIAGSAPSSAP